MEFEKKGMEKWSLPRIGDIVVKAGAQAPDKNPSVLYTYIDISSVNRDTKLIDDPKTILGKDAPSRARKEVKPGDVLFATTRPNLQNVAILPDSFVNPVASTGFCILRVKSNIAHNKYLFYYLLTTDIQRHIEPLIRGAQYPAISDKDLLSCQIPLPPLPEQTRIVAKLDALFECIDQAIALLEKNIRLTGELMAAVLGEVFGELEEREKGISIENLFKIRSGDFLPQREMIETGEYNVFGGNGITGKHNLFNLEGENVLIGRVGAYCGNVRFVNESLWLTDNAFYISEFKKDINKAFLAEYLTFVDLGKTSNQAAQPVISYKGIKDLTLHIPNMELQKSVVNYISRAREVLNILRQAQTQKLRSIQALKSSMLDQAFRGEL